MDTDLDSPVIQLENDRLLTRFVMTDSKFFRLYGTKSTKEALLPDQEQLISFQQTGGLP